MPPSAESKGPGNPDEHEPAGSGFTPPIEPEPSVEEPTPETAESPPEEIPAESTESPDEVSPESTVPPAAVHSETEELPPQQAPTEETTLARVDLRQYLGQPEFKVAEIQARERAMLDLGISKKALAKLRQSHPALVDSEQAKDALVALKTHGFTNLVALIEKHPPILGYSTDNVTRRIRLFNRLIKLFGPDLNAIELMTSRPNLFSAKIAKLLVLTRLAAKSSSPTTDIDGKTIQALVIESLENNLLAANQLAGKYNISELRNKAQQIRRSSLTTREQKRQLIKNSLVLDQLDPKIKTTYFRAYPVKESEDIR